MFQKGSRVAGKSAPQTTDNVEPNIANNVQQTKPKKKKGKRTWKFYVGTIAVVAAFASAVFAAYHFGVFNNVIKKYFNNNSDDTNKDEITAVADLLPIDNDGIIEITYPIVDRTLEEANGRYSLPEGMIPYFINNTESNVSLSQSKNGKTDNVKDYESNSENKPVGYIGLNQEYAGFMSRIEDIKVKIAAGDSTYTAPLHPEVNEVPDVYSIPEGYDLYTEDEEAKGQAKLAYVAEDKTKVYIIPSKYVSKFIGVKTEIIVLINKYEGLREQIIFAYNIYNSNSREMLGAIDEETTNRCR